MSSVDLRSFCFELIELKCWVSGTTFAVDRSDGLIPRGTYIVQAWKFIEKFAFFPDYSKRFLYYVPESFFSELAIKIWNYGIANALEIMHYGIQLSIYKHLSISCVMWGRPLTQSPTVFGVCVDG